MPRFVILHHQLPENSERASHWDLMLEQGDTLRTWALDRPLAPDSETPCRALADHRLAYLDYEGPVSGNRGTVARVERGEYATLEETANSLRVRLKGEQIVGVLLLQRVSADARDAASDQNWVARLFPESAA